MSKPRVVIAVDTFGWAFENIARQIERHYSDRYNIKIVDRVDPQHEIRCDVALFMWWKAALAAATSNSVFADRIAIGMYDHWSIRNHPQNFAKVVPVASCFFAGNEAIQADLKLRVPDKPVYLTEDGVDLDVFTLQPFPDTFTVGWTGNRIYESIGLGDLKGCRLIEEAARRCNVPLVIQDKQERQVPQAEMPQEFYRKISCYVCASEAEGTPNPVLEALACGRPVVSTRVGIVPKVAAQALGSTVMVDRTVDDIVRGIQAVRGNLSAHWACCHIPAWDWKRKAHAFGPVLEGEA